MEKEYFAYLVTVQLAKERMTQQKLAKVLRITPAALSNKMNGKSPFKVLEVIFIFKVLKFSDEMILDVMKSKKNPFPSPKKKK